MFNEPEYMTLDSVVALEDTEEGRLGSSNKISLDKVQAFVKKCNDVIRSKGFLTTMGSVSIKYNCNCGNGCQGNWWKDIGLSFYSVHFYSWMAEGGSKYDPFTTKPSDWCLDKETLIEESPDYTD
jgi:hypothetical protein